MPVWKWLIFYNIYSVSLWTITFFILCNKIASKCTREEERRNAYINTGNDIKK